MTADGAVLIINSGSSSIKFAMFDLTSNEPERIWRGALERIGFDIGRFVVQNVQEVILNDQTLAIPDHATALHLLLSWVKHWVSPNNLIGIGHRVVHGGPNCDCSLLVTPELETQLTQFIPLAPLHLPHNLAGIAAVRSRRPDLPQVACFDTAFHHNLPRVAQLTSLPRRFQNDGIRRYGFHGLSYEYIIENVRQRDGDAAANARIIIAHLGNGASMAAIKGRRSIETSMGFSTLAGLPMGTRSGDLDPGILLYLLIEKKMSPEQIQHVLYRESGLLGLSDLSRNMVDLLAHQNVPAVAEAIDYFCHHARRHLVGLTASLGGLDRLVFTGGIGANSPEIRSRICDNLDYLGLDLSAERNADQNGCVSADDSSVLIEAIKTDEETVIARHSRDLLVGYSDTKVHTNA